MLCGNALRDEAKRIESELENYRGVEAVGRHLEALHDAVEQRISPKRLLIAGEQGSGKSHLDNITCLASLVNPDEFDKGVHQGKCGAPRVKWSKEGTTEVYVHQDTAAELQEHGGLSIQSWKQQYGATSRTRIITREDPSIDATPQDERCFLQTVSSSLVNNVIRRRHGQVEPLCAETGGRAGSTTQIFTERVSSGVVADVLQLRSEADLAGIVCTDAQYMVDVLTAKDVSFANAMDKPAFKSAWQRVVVLVLGAPEAVSLLEGDRARLVARLSGLVEPDKCALKLHPLFHEPLKTEKIIVDGASELGPGALSGALHFVRRTSGTINALSSLVLGSSAGSLLPDHETSRDSRVGGLPQYRRLALQLLVAKQTKYRPSQRYEGTSVCDMTGTGDAAQDTREQERQFNSADTIVIVLTRSITLVNGLTHQLSLCSEFIPRMVEEPQGDIIVWVNMSETGQGMPVHNLCDADLKADVQEVCHGASSWLRQTAEKFGTKEQVDRFMAHVHIVPAAPTTFLACITGSEQDRDAILTEARIGSCNQELTLIDLLDRSQGDKLLGRLADFKLEPCRRYVSDVMKVLLRIEAGLGDQEALGLAIDEETVKEADNVYDCMRLG